VQWREPTSDLNVIGNCEISKVAVVGFSFLRKYQGKYTWLRFLRGCVNGTGRDRANFADVESS
jgi:hypothetical protein